MVDVKSELINDSLELMLLGSRFHDPEWHQFVLDGLAICAPMEFFIQPASTSGKYHQGYELGVGGLVRHTIAAMEVARTLFPIYGLDEREEDMVTAALALHDIGKPSKTHPIEAELILEPIRDRWPKHVKEVIMLIKTHHGQWDYFGKMPRPKTELQYFVHLCDYLASRKNIAVDINYKGE